MKELLDELWDEVSDFFEDYGEHLFHIKPKSTHRQKPAVIDGALVLVRPAYHFAERVDNMLKVIFGFSICVSAVTATIFGFTSVSGFVEFLISTTPGRMAMLIIGTSYLLTAFWRLMHIGQKNGK
jgi:hypothetical protein